jgi:hypothetical protein
MKHEYDLFEKFPDGSSLWWDSVSRLETARLRLRELVQRSENQFYAINLANGEIPTFTSGRAAHGFRVHSKTESRSKSHAV